MVRVDATERTRGCAPRRVPASGASASVAGTLGKPRDDRHAHALAAIGLAILVLALASACGGERRHAAVRSVAASPAGAATRASASGARTRGQPGGASPASARGVGGQGAGGRARAHVPAASGPAPAAPRGAGRGDQSPASTVVGGSATTAHRGTPRSASPGAAGAAIAPARTAPGSTGVQVPVQLGNVTYKRSGRGDVLLGTITLSGAHTLVWSSTATPFQMYTSSGFLLVDSNVTHGSVEILRGTYREVRVATRGDWSVELLTKPQASRRNR
jgi:hypothetical protein